MTESVTDLIQTVRSTDDARDYRLACVRIAAEYVVEGRTVASIVKAATTFADFVAGERAERDAHASPIGADLVTGLRTMAEKRAIPGVAPIVDGGGGGE